MLTKPSSDKRKTSKWIPLIQHRALGKCAILVKEQQSKKYGLLWGWINTRENEKEEALKRELTEEVWKKCSIKRLKSLVEIETNSQIHTIFALKISGNLNPNPREIVSFGFYPFEKQYEEERTAIKTNMEYYAIQALEIFRNKHRREEYQSSDVKIEKKYFDSFHRELDKLKKEIGKK